MRGNFAYRGLRSRAWLSIVVGLALACASCAPAVTLRNPETGHRVTCEGGFRAQGLGGILDGSANQVQRRCVDEFQQHGYVQVAGRP